MQDIETATSECDIVYRCVGVRPCVEFLPPSALGPRGEVNVNGALKVKCQNGELFGNGRVFALGDCVSVEEIPPFTKDTYPAEAMAGIVIQNLASHRQLSVLDLTMPRCT